MGPAFSHSPTPNPENSDAWNFFRQNRTLPRLELLQAWVNDHFLTSPMSPDEIVDTENDFIRDSIERLDEIRALARESVFLNNEIQRRHKLITEGAREVSLFKPIFEITRQEGKRGDLYGIFDRGPFKSFPSGTIGWAFSLERYYDTQLLSDPGDILWHQMKLWDHLFAIESRSNAPDQGYDGWLSETFHQPSQISPQAERALRRRLLKQDAIFDLNGKEYYLIPEPNGEIHCKVDLRYEASQIGIVQARCYISWPGGENWGYDLQKGERLIWPKTGPSQKATARLWDKILMRNICTELLQWGTRITKAK